jgi:hypothetical protein
LWLLAWAYSQAGLFGLDYAQLPSAFTNEVAIIVGYLKCVAQTWLFFRQLFEILQESADPDGDRPI